MEECDPCKQYEVEQEYINKYKPYRTDIGYNIARDARHIPKWAYNLLWKNKKDKLPITVNELNIDSCEYSYDELIEYCDGIDTMLEYGTEAFGYKNFEEFAEDYFD